MKRKTDSAGRIRFRCRHNRLKKNKGIDLNNRCKEKVEGNKKHGDTHWCADISGVHNHIISSELLSQRQVEMYRSLIDYHREIDDISLEKWK